VLAAQHALLPTARSFLLHPDSTEKGRVSAPFYHMSF
jgi:hypothetical protein